LWFVQDSSKLDSAHLEYLQGFVVQFPRNTGSSEVVSNLNLTGPLKSQDFSAFGPVEQIGKLCSPAKIGLNLGFVRSKLFLWRGVPAPVLFPLFWGI